MGGVRRAPLVGRQRSPAFPKVHRNRPLRSAPRCGCLASHEEGPTRESRSGDGQKCCRNGQQVSHDYDDPAAWPLVGAENEEACRAAGARERRTGSDAPQHSYRRASTITDDEVTFPGTGRRAVLALGGRSLIRNMFCSRPEPDCRLRICGRRCVRPASRILRSPFQIDPNLRKCCGGASECGDGSLQSALKGRGVREQVPSESREVSGDWVAPDLPQFALTCPYSLRLASLLPADA